MKHWGSVVSAEVTIVLQERMRLIGGLNHNRFASLSETYDGLLLHLLMVARVQLTIVYVGRTFVFTDCAVDNEDSKGKKRDVPDGKHASPGFYLLASPKVK